MAISGNPFLKMAVERAYERARQLGIFASFDSDEIVFHGRTKVCENQDFMGELDRTVLCQDSRTPDISKAWSTFPAPGTDGLYFAHWRRAQTPDLSHTDS